MEMLVRPSSTWRCLRNIQRNRILGVRCLSTTTSNGNISSSSNSKPGRVQGIREYISDDLYIPMGVTAPTASPSGRGNGSSSNDSTNTTFPKQSATGPSSPALLTPCPNTLHLYTHAPAPTPTQLSAATHFFTQPSATHLYSTHKFLHLPSSPFPEVAFLGRSNVGKSSLLNALFGTPRARLAHVSKKPGRTRTMNAFGVGPERNVISASSSGEGEDAKWSEAGTQGWRKLGKGGLVVMDMPGYGGGSRAEWGAEIVKYLAGRKQLRQTFLLIDAEHGLKPLDMRILAHLHGNGTAYTLLLSKADKLLRPGPKVPSPEKLSSALAALRDVIERDVVSRICREVGVSRAAVGDVLSCSAEKGVGVDAVAGRLGVDAVRWAVLRACGMDGVAVR